MLTTGDLVRIKDDAFKYFAGKLALVDHLAYREEYWDDAGKLRARLYYLITLSGTTDCHIFVEDDLTIVSKAYEINE